jgi:NAD(P)-dependent dehydrogenase (short-subunit alcohol dehydrogenase family)
MNLNNKIIIVTGGSGLLGNSIIDDIRSNGGIAINADIKSNIDNDPFFENCDVTNQQSVEELIDSVVNKYGKIDGFVNNAYPRTSDWGTHFEQIKFDSWKLNVDLQLNSVFICCQSILKQMKKQKFGSIVNISSIYGSVGPDFNIYKGTEMTMPAAYSAIKGGIVNFSKYIASYFGSYGIRVNCVSPGGIFDNQPLIFMSNYEQKVPLRRLAKPNEISPSVSFLLSDSSSYITGHNLFVDGGWTAI